MHAMIAKVRNLDLMAEINHQATCLAYECEIIFNGNASGGEPHVMIRAQAHDVLRSVRAVMRRSQWAKIHRFGIRTGGTFEPGAAYLTTKMVERFERPGLLGFADDTENRRGIG